MAVGCETFGLASAAGLQMAGLQSAAVVTEKRSGKTKTAFNGTMSNEGGNTAVPLHFAPPSRDGSLTRSPE